MRNSAYKRGEKEKEKKIKEKKPQKVTVKYYNGNGTP